MSNIIKILKTATNYTDIVVVFSILMIFDIDSLNFWDFFEQLFVV